MSFSFPTSPSVNQLYTFGNKTWKYNGTGWILVTNVDVAQTAWNKANLANVQANTATVLAQGAYNSSNTKFSSSGGTINGSIDITQNLSVTGNLTILGSSTSINTSSFTVQDTLLLLGLGNYTSDLLDIGFVSHYNDGTNAHTGIIRDASEKQWMFFEDYTPEVSPNNNIIITHPSFRHSNVRVRDVTGNLIANTVHVNGYNLFDYTTNSFAHANGAYDQANSAANYANSAFNYANSAFSRANNSLNVTTGGIVAGNVTANSFIANTSIYSPIYYSPSGTTNLTLSDIGIVAINSGGQETKFGASGIEAISVYSGNYGGNKISLNNETNIISNRYDVVKIQTGTTGSISNEWSFSNNTLIFPDSTIQTTAWTGAAGVYANAAFGTANSAASYANAAFLQANAVYQYANTLSPQDNVARYTANSAALYANGAFLQANAAFGVANAALPKVGGTLSGDLTITGNLFINGTTTTVNTTTVATTDSLIKLANNNILSDTLDIGFYGVANTGTVTYHGLARQAGSNNFLLFKGLTQDPTGNTLSGGSATAANVGTLIANVAGYSITSNGVDLFLYTTNAYTQANTGVNNASGASLYANAAFLRANTPDPIANSAALYANGAFIQANAAFAKANTITTAGYVDAFVADGATDGFVLSVTPADKNITFVTVQGVLQPKSVYSLSGSTLTFDFYPPPTAAIEVTTLTTYNGTGGSGGSGSGSIVYRGYTGNNTQSNFTISSGLGVNNLLVAENGILQRPTTDYTISGANVVFSTPPASSVDVQIREITLGGGSSFTWSIVSANTTMSASTGYFVDTSGGAKTMTLPTTATLGDTIRINDLTGTFGTNNLTVARNGHKIQGSANDLLVGVDQSSFGLVYSNSTYGWKVLEL